MLVERGLFGTRDKVADAIERIRLFEPKDRPYHLAFSGGKDSQCIYHLAIEAGVNFEAHYNLTTVDPPELVRFIKRQYPEVHIDRPEYSMWELILRNRVMPTKIYRYCCRYLKERVTPARSTVILGIRSAESPRRASRHKLIRKCPNSPSVTWVCPILDWLEEDVWEYIKGKGLEYCELYDQGWKRVGCVMCPQGNEKNMRRDAERWPIIYRAYYRSGQRLLDLRDELGLKQYHDNIDEMMEWWVSDSKKKEDETEQCFAFD